MGCAAGWGRIFTTGSTLMGSHASSIEFLEWGCKFSDFWGKKVLHTYDQQTYQNVCTADEK